MVWFGLDWFHGISTIVDYLIPNPFLYVKTVFIQPIQFKKVLNLKAKIVLF